MATFNTLKTSLVMGMFVSASAMTGAGTATAQVNSSTNHQAQAADELGQVTSVSQLSDVFPTDWAFQAVQSLVERYGCIAGYPNGTFRGNNKATRYEMAAALNACLDQISDRFASKADIDMVKALQAEFAAELATLRGRVDGLEARVATVEAQQFSTTTKLKGEVLFAASFTVDEDEFGSTADDRAAFGGRVRLNFDTSFSGTDRLRVRLQTGNIESLAGSGSTGTALAVTSFDDVSDGSVNLEELNYQFKPTKKLFVKVDANAGEFNDNVNVFNPLLADSASGSISQFARFNPIYRQGVNGEGITFHYELAKGIDFEAGYLADDGSDPVDPGFSGGESGGLFGGSYAALAQLAVKPLKNADLELGFTYVRSHDEAGNVSLTGGITDVATNAPFGNLDDVDQDHLGFQMNYLLSDTFNLSGWVGYTFANQQGGANDDAELLNWSAQLAFLDLLGEGNVAVLAVGQQPSVVGGSIGAAADGTDANWLVQAQYKFKVSDNIAITPGVFVVINPDNNSANDPIFVPVIRTVFDF